MASTSAVRSPAPRPLRLPQRGRLARPSLTILAAPRTGRSVIPFALLCTLIVVAALGSVLYLNVEMTGTSYEITRLQNQSQRLSEEQQALAETNDQLGTPQALEQQARELGMVPVDDPAYIDLTTGEILGSSDAAAAQSGGDTAPAPASIPPAQIYDQPDSYHGMGNEGV